MVQRPERRRPGVGDGSAGDLTAAHQALEAASREHWARLLALLIREYADVDVAEESLQEAYAAAVEHWRRGVPDNPAGWLLTTARRKATDRLRRQATLARKLPLLVVDAPTVMSDDLDVDGIPDERLRLICTCSHPALSHEASVALTLRLVAGLQTREIARLFLVSESTMAARITRAKRKIAASGIPFRVPDRADLPARLSRICAVSYLLFTEGYAATSGPDLMRVELCAEAIRLQRVVVDVVPDAEAMGLMALMLLQHARRDARVVDGALVSLGEQDRSRWHHDDVDEGRHWLRRAAALSRGPGSYTLQAAIATEHMRATTAADTDWSAIARLYVQLERLTGSPVVRMNRAVAVAEAEGPAAGLAVLDGLDEELPRNHRLPATRAELLRRLGDRAGAMAQYDRALEWVGTDAERSYLAGRRDELTGDS